MLGNAIALVAIAALFGLEAYKVKDRIPRLVLAALAVIFGAGGVFLQPIVGRAPEFGKFLSNLFDQPLAWLIIFALLFLVLRPFWSRPVATQVLGEASLPSFDAEPLTQSGKAEAGMAGPDNPPLEMPPPLYVARVTVNLRELNDHHRLELAVFAFNWSGRALRFSRVSGKLPASFVVENGPARMMDMNLPFELPERGPVLKEPYMEFVLVFHCQLDPAQVQFVKDGLATGRNVSFETRRLVIEMEDADEPKDRFTLPIKGGVTVRTTTAADELFYGTIAYAEMKVTLSSSSTVD